MLSVYGSSSRDRHTQQDGRGSHSGSVGYMEDGRRQAGTRAHTEERSTPGYKGTRAWWVVRPVLWVGPFLCWVGGCALGELRMGRIYRDGYMSVSVLYR